MCHLFFGRSLAAGSLCTGFFAAVRAPCCAAGPRGCSVPAAWAGAQERVPEVADLLNGEGVEGQAALQAEDREAHQVRACDAARFELLAEATF